MAQRKRVLSPKRVRNALAEPEPQAAAGRVYAEQLATIFRGVRISGGRGPLDDGYYRITEWRDWWDTTQRVVALSVGVNYQLQPPVQGDKFVFSNWIKNYYASDKVHYIVADDVGNQLDLQVFFPRPLGSECWKTKMVFNGVRSQLLTCTTYTTGVPVSCGFPIPEPPFYI